MEERVIHFHKNKYIVICYAIYFNLTEFLSVLPYAILVILPLPWCIYITAFIKNKK